MKSLLSLFLVLFMLQAVAKDKGFSQAMQPLMEKTAGINESAEFQQLAEEYEKVAAKYPDEWLPLYFTAYHYVNAADKNSEGNAKAAFYKLADEYIAKGLNEAPEQSEFYALRAFVIDRKQKTTAKINNNEWLTRFNRAITNAKKYGPENPRAHLVSAMHLIYRPGKLEEAKKDADRAVVLYENVVKDFHPDWGRNSAISLSRKLQSN